MKHLLLVASAILFFTNVAKSQCTESNDPKVLLIGDSWAFFMNADGTFDDVLSHWGLSNQRYLSNPTLAVSGARTEDFLTAGRLSEIETQLLANPTIKVVHLSISGNDFLGNWNVDFTETELTALSDETYNEVITLTDFIKDVRPDVQIVFSGYMYANFEEVIQDAAPFETSHPFYATWEDMGFPNFEQLNTLLNGFSERMVDLALADPRIDFINAPALMQYEFGQESPLDVDPGGTYPAFYQPLPYGDITYPSPKESMRDYGLVRDCFHLSAEGFFKMIDYQFLMFYQKYLMDEIYFLADEEMNIGSVSASGSYPGEVQLGDNSGEQLSTLLSFNTTTMADTTLEGASLFLRRAGLVGGNPIGETLNLKMKTGYFGGSILCENDDFDAGADIEVDVCVFGESDENSDWIRIDLPEEVYSLLSNENITQFMLTSEDASDELILFSGAGDPDFAPILNLNYTSSFAGIEEKNLVENQVTVYPNPTNNQLYFYSSNQQDFDQVEIIDLQGNIVQTQQATSNQVDVSTLGQGTYILRIVGKDQIQFSSFIKY
jgi:hypothetical protein